MASKKQKRKKKKKKIAVIITRKNARRLEGRASVASNIYNVPKLSIQKKIVVKCVLRMEQKINKQINK